MFLKFANFYKRFVKFYARITLALTTLFINNKNEKQIDFFNFNVEVQKAFRFFINAFINALMLIHFDLKNFIQIKIDASNFIIAIILFQLIFALNDFEEKKWHFVAFYSRKMIFAKSCYETHDQKLLTIIITFKQWKHYLKNSRYFVTILTDHNNLRYFMTTMLLNRR